MPKRRVSKAKPPIRTAIIVDPFGCLDASGEDEIAAHVERLTTLLKPRRLLVQTPSWVDDATLDADLVVFDYGGMGPGNDLMQDNSRRLARWAMDHSSSLIVVASMFTYSRGLEPELRDIGKIDEEQQWTSIVDRAVDVRYPLPNLLVYQGHEEEIAQRIRAWFGLPVRRTR